MKELKLTTEEYMLLRQLALQFGFTFQHSYSNGTVRVLIAEEFCDAFGY